MQTKPRRKKPNNISWNIVLTSILLILLGITYIVFYKGKKPEPKKEYPKTLVNIQDFISINVEGRFSYSITNRDNKLYLNDIDPISNNKQELIYRLIKNINVEDKIKIDENEDTGLNKAHLIIDVLLNDNKHVRLNIGNKIPLYDQYYFSIGDSNVYAINNGYEDIFNTDPKLLIVSDTTDIYRSMIKTITVKNAEKTIEIAFNDISKKNIFAQVISPIKYPADIDTINSIVASLVNIDLSLYIKDYNGESEYGFYDKDAICYIVDQNIGSEKNSQLDNGKRELIFGRDVDQFYKYLLYNNRVYKISKLPTQSILSFKLENIISKKIFNLSPMDLDKLELIRDISKKQTNIWHILNSNTKNPIVQKNDEQFDAEAFIDAIKKIMKLEINYYDGEINLSNLEKLRSIEITFNNTTQTIEFFNKDAYNYYVAIDGVSLGYCQKQDIDNILFVE